MSLEIEKRGETMAKLNTNKLREMRQEKGVTQKEMAELLGYKGISGYTMIENNTNALSLDKAKIIANFFGVTIEDLFFKDEHQEK